ncbi:MAG: FtsX-like permease family protein [Helicobacteraceae bacterium]|jgi:putative ABC transport system permease protein|nr:FtsX-like permease family protein [Helicobacteraceae bacterium]
MVSRLRSSNLKLFLSALIGVFIRRRSRSTVALIAISLGATAFFGMLTIYYDAPRRLSEIFRAYGANVLLTGEGGVTKEDIANVKALLSENGLAGIAPYEYKSALLNGRSVTTARTDLAQAFAVNPYWQVSGELPSVAGEAAAGYDLAEALNLKAGSKALLDNAKEIAIRAVVKTGGGGDEVLYISADDNFTADLAELSVSASGDALQTAMNDLSAKLPRLTPKLIKRVANSETVVLKKLNALMTLVTIAAIALTMICVSSTMAATVAERQKEIGLKKAIGAENRDIIAEFLSEALVLGLFGGALGSLFGFALANFVSLSAFSTSVGFNFVLALATIAVSAVFTAAAAIFPAYSAARVNPIAVLREE